MLPRLTSICMLAVLACSRAAVAQTPPPESPRALDIQQDVQQNIDQYQPPAYVSAVDGGATLERDGRIEAAPLNMPLLSGDRLRTTDGRVEVRFADGGRLHLDMRTSVDVLSDDLVRLTDGRIRLSVQRAAQVSYRVDAPMGSVRIVQPGEYRIALMAGQRETQLEFAVIRGAGEIFTDQGATTVQSGERAYASSGLLPSYAIAYNSANPDEFDRWSDMQRGTVYAAASESSQYLPSDLGSYASTFDQYGDWRYQQTYGYVWYPRVSVGWRPYYYGRWATYPSYGWTWIAGDPFGYPTHHYGRWGVSAGAWFWIPSRYWGPAYVSWGYAPSYVSWCPLGWNNRAVFSIGYYNVGPAYYAGHYRGHYATAWTTVPRGRFGHGYYAHQNAVNWDRPGYTAARPQFTEARRGPDRDVAVARGSGAPIRYGGTRVAPGVGPATGGSRAATATRSVDGGSQRFAPSGDRAVPRASETPRYINRGERIVRSQTERPTPPRDTAVARSAPFAANDAAPSRADAGPRSSGGSYIPQARRTDPASDLREGRTGDHPAYWPAPPVGDVRSRTAAPSYERAIPRAPNVPSSIAPRGDENTGMPRSYSRPETPDRGYARPYGGDTPYARPPAVERTYERPSAGERAYERPSAGRMTPAPQPERAAPAPPPPAAGRPVERVAPSSAPRTAGERAVPRGGGRQR